MRLAEASPTRIPVPLCQNQLLLPFDCFSLWHPPLCILLSSLRLVSSLSCSIPLSLVSPSLFLAPSFILSLKMCLKQGTLSCRCIYSFPLSLSFFLFFSSSRYLNFNSDTHTDSHTHTDGCCCGCWLLSLTIYASNQMLILFTLAPHKVTEWVYLASSPCLFTGWNEWTRKRSRRKLQLVRNVENEREGERRRKIEATPVQEEQANVNRLLDQPSGR